MIYCRALWTNRWVAFNEVHLSNFYPMILGAFTYSGFSRPKWISVAKSAKLRKSMIEKRDPKKHLSLSVATCDLQILIRSLAPNKISQPVTKVLTQKTQSGMSQRSVAGSLNPIADCIMFNLYQSPRGGKDGLDLFKVTVLGSQKFYLLKQKSVPKANSFRRTGSPSKYMPYMCHALCERAFTQCKVKWVQHIIFLLHSSYLYVPVFNHYHNSTKLTRSEINYK